MRRQYAMHMACIMHVEHVQESRRSFSVNRPTLIHALQKDQRDTQTLGVCKSTLRYPTSESFLIHGETKPV